MAKRRNLLSLIIAVPVVYGVSRAYRPVLGTSVGAFVDLVLVFALFFAIRSLFAKLEGED